GVTHSPSVFVVTVLLIPMGGLLTFTSAPATTAPEASWTVPVNVPVSCAKAAPEISRNTAKHKAMRTIFMAGSVELSSRSCTSALRPLGAHDGTHERAADRSSRNCSVGRVQKCAWAPHPRLLLNLLKRIKYSYPAAVKRKNEEPEPFAFPLPPGLSRRLVLCGGAS